MGPRAGEYADRMGPRAGEDEDRMEPRAGEDEDRIGPRAGERGPHGAQGWWARSSPATLYVCAA